MAASVVRPSLPSCWGDEASVSEHLQVSRCCRLAHAELVDDELIAAPMFERVAVLLRWKVGDRVLQPLENLEPTFARKRFQRSFEIDQWLRRLT